MARVLYSTKSKDKVVHLSHCAYSRRIDNTNRRAFESAEEAYAQGYRFCNCCPAIAKKYRAEKRAIVTFCREKQMQFFVKNEIAHIISRHDCWRIIVNGQAKRIFLYHKNTDKRRSNKFPSMISGYHSQAIRSETIIGYLEYIAEHDKLRDKHPCTENIRTKIRCGKTVVPEWKIEKYGEEYFSYDSYKKIRGTKKYRKEQKRKKRQKRKAQIIRTLALIDELQVING